MKTDGSEYFIKIFLNYSVHPRNVTFAMEENFLRINKNKSFHSRKTLQTFLKETVFWKILWEISS